MKEIHERFAGNALAGLAVTFSSGIPVILGILLVIYFANQSLILGCISLSNEYEKG